MAEAAALQLVDGLPDVLDVPGLARVDGEGVTCAANERECLGEGARWAAIFVSPHVESDDAMPIVLRCVEYILSNVDLVVRREPEELLAIEAEDEANVDAFVPQGNRRRLIHAMKH